MAPCCQSARHNIVCFAGWVKEDSRWDGPILVPGAIIPLILTVTRGSESWGYWPVVMMDGMPPLVGLGGGCERVYG